MGATALSIVGHADTVGSQGYNQGLSERRARRVANALVERGVPAGGMTLAGRGENDLARATGDNVREPLNRRVEISLSK
jgi:outer membrane protein OmpA-like peptidoglycan-associated protein